MPKSAESSGTNGSRVGADLLDGRASQIGGFGLAEGFLQKRYGVRTLLDNGLERVHGGCLIIRLERLGEDFGHSLWSWFEIVERGDRGSRHAGIFAGGDINQSFNRFVGAVFEFFQRDRGVVLNDRVFVAQQLPQSGG